MEFNMKTVLIILMFCFGLNKISYSQNNKSGVFKPLSIRELLDESKNNKERNVLLSSWINIDSLDVLINEKYNLENVNITKIDLESDDSLLENKLLNFLKPISNKIIELRYQCTFEHDLTQFTNLIKLDLLFPNKYIDISSLQRLKTVTDLRVSIFGACEINKSSSICFLENITSVTFKNYNHDNSLKTVNYNLITSFPKLEKLNIRDYSLTHIPESWSTLTKLEYIDIRCIINDNSLNTLLNLPKWYYISVISKGFCPNIDIQEFKDIMCEKENINPLFSFYLSLEEISNSSSSKPFFYKEELMQLKYLKRKLESKKESQIFIFNRYHRKYNKIKRNMN